MVTLVNLLEFCRSNLLQLPNKFKPFIEILNHTKVNLVISGTDTSGTSVIRSIVSILLKNTFNNFLYTASSFSSYKLFFFYTYIFVTDKTKVLHVSSRIAGQSFAEEIAGHYFIGSLGMCSYLQRMLTMYSLLYNLSNNKNYYNIK